MGAAVVNSTDHRRFLRDVSSAKTRVLLIDYDGTVAPFSSDRRRARPYPDLPPLLHRIMTNCGTRLIIVSGRSAREVPTLLGIHPTPEVWGSHGVERLFADGRYQEINVNDDALAALAEAEFRLADEGLDAHVEIKLAALAVHWRGLHATDVLRIRSKAYKLLKPMTSRADLVLTEFDEGVELRLQSANKGKAVRSFLDEIEDKVPVAYLGDDVDDEDAFRALNGRGLTVLVKPKAQFTAAQVVLKPPSELVRFLEDWIRACGGKA